ncbi:MAG TPA: NAD(P)H-dependent oxidoreductase [Candidatus Paceibacterota bacterium]
MAKLLAVSGSLRAGSYNTALAQAFIKQAPAGTTIEFIEPSDVGALPLFNQDMEAAFPPAAAALKDRIKAADGIIIATPEYNRSIPGPLKNFMDWTSRPYGDNAWKGKHVYVAGATGGAVGTALAQAALRQVLLYLDARVLGQPEFYLTGAGEKFGTDGTLTDEKTREHIDAALGALITSIHL